MRNFFLEERPRLLVIVGPTGSGKTELALHLGERLGGEIVSADSQQVYRQMDIGTGKATATERARVPHHLLDVLSPKEEMTAAQYVELADRAVARFAHHKRPVIIAGGTMLYVRALLHGLFVGPGANSELRDVLRERAREEGVFALWSDLQSFDPISAARIHKTDERRLIRAIEVYRLSGIPLSEHHRRHQERGPRYEFRMFGIHHERDELYRRIDARVDAMLQRGFVQEVMDLREAGIGPQVRSQQAIGYAELHRYLDGCGSLGEAVEKIKRNSRRYARRQLSWYRSAASVQWLTDPLGVDLGALQGYLRRAGDKGNRP